MLRRFLHKPTGTIAVETQLLSKCFSIEGTWKDHDYVPAKIVLNGKDWQEITKKEPRFVPWTCNIDSHGNPLPVSYGMYDTVENKSIGYTVSSYSMAISNANWRNREGGYELFEPNKK